MLDGRYQRKLAGASVFEDVGVLGFFNFQRRRRASAGIELAATAGEGKGQERAEENRGETFSFHCRTSAAGAEFRRRAEPARRIRRPRNSCDARAGAGNPGTIPTKERGKVD